MPEHDLKRNREINAKMKQMLEDYQGRQLTDKQALENDRQAIIDRSKGYILVSMQKENTDKTDIQTALPASDLERKLLCFDALLASADLLKREDPNIDPVEYLQNYYESRKHQPK